MVAVTLGPGCRTVFAVTPGPGCHGVVAATRASGFRAVLTRRPGPGTRAAPGICAAGGAGARGRAQASWSYTVTGMFRATSRSVTSGSIRDHFPPASPQPMRGMCTDAPRSAAWPARAVRAVSIAS
ncbi:hypothetical protein FHX78_11774 [Streptomyces capillispiralis]|uniref:Uncharacterized protein n=1 Tax=Streptomyces capillispiralis TaxID=68182 RepID=A0A561T9T4_9ACTN|nr:hypothetical protein FHX78_11774 [Streptomyces capillispiralis]